MSDLRYDQLEAQYYDLEARARERDEHAAGIHTLACRRIEELKEMLREVLASANPNGRDHPSMSRAWERAERVLEGLSPDE